MDFEDFEFVEDGNIDELSTAILDSYFSGKMHQTQPFVSCAYKHFLALDKIVKSEELVALIIEDDIMFHTNFEKFFPLILAEIEKKKNKKSRYLKFQQKNA